jgi:hypothetical protein
VKAKIRAWLFAALVGILMRRGLTLEQAQGTAVQMTDTPLSALWKWRRRA